MAEHKSAGWSAVFKSTPTISKCWKFGLDYRKTWTELPADAVYLTFSHRTRNSIVTTIGVVQFMQNKRKGGIAHALGVVDSELAAGVVKHADKDDAIYRVSCYPDTTVLGALLPRPGHPVSKQAHDIDPYFCRTPPIPSQLEMEAAAAAADVAAVQAALEKPKYNPEGLPADWIELFASIMERRAAPLDAYHKYKAQMDFIEKMT